MKLFMKNYVTMLCEVLKAIEVVLNFVTTVIFGTFLGSTIALCVGLWMGNCFVSESIF